MVDIEKKYKELKVKWQDETAYFSSLSMKVDNPHHQKICNLGSKIVPIILNEFRNGDIDHLFFALRNITGADPIPEEDRGKVQKMAQHWVNWGIKEGIIE
tara:strand:+ start:5132 stop:5431 length:300 start_codon:yes stop_codon:yes gene_type:complete